jgi:hypothetical protein
MPVSSEGYCDTEMPLKVLALTPLHVCSGRIDNQYLHHAIADSKT